MGESYGDSATPKYRFVDFKNRIAQLRVSTAAVGTRRKSE